MEHIAFQFAPNVWRKIDLKQYSHLLDNNLYLDILIETKGEPVYFYAIKEGKKTSKIKQWSRLVRDNWQLFFWELENEQRVAFAARTLITFHSPELAKALWGKEDYSYFSLFSPVYKVDISQIDFNEAMYYELNAKRFGFVATIATDEILELLDGCSKLDIDFLSPEELKKPDTDKDADDITPDPMYIDSFKVLDLKNLAGSMALDLEQKVKDIFSYHETSAFASKNYITSTSPARKHVSINIAIENSPNNDALKRKINNEIDELARAINKAKISKDTIEIEKVPEKYRRIVENIKEYGLREYGNIIEGIVGMLREWQKVTTDENYGRIIGAFPYLGEDWIEIKNRIHQIEYLINLLNALGIFSNVDGVHLYWDRLKNESAANGGDFFELVVKVAAHEMEHAWHYADVKSSSGKWSLANKPKYLWVKESIAEYFSLCYCITDHNTTGIDYVHRRRIQDFPNDGGYSGALILEHGKKDFKALYAKSLNDMEQAFDEELL